LGDPCRPHSAEPNCCRRQNLSLRRLYDGERKEEPITERRYFFAGNLLTVVNVFSGWGEYLGALVDLPVVNRAIGGRSARSFTEEGRFNEVAKLVSPGDCMLCSTRKAILPYSFMFSVLAFHPDSLLYDDRKCWGRETFFTVAELSQMNNANNCFN
jgi:hypothetical protein